MSGNTESMYYVLSKGSLYDWNYACCPRELRQQKSIYRNYLAQYRSPCVINIRLSLSLSPPYPFLPPIHSLLSLSASFPTSRPRAYMRLRERARWQPASERSGSMSERAHVAVAGELSRWHGRARLGERIRRLADHHRPHLDRNG